MRSCSIIALFGGYVLSSFEVRDRPGAPDTVVVMDVTVHPKDEGLPSLPRDEIVVGQIWEYRGYLMWSKKRNQESRLKPSWTDKDRHGRLKRLRIVQVPGGRRRTIRYVWEIPPWSGNGRPDRGEHPIQERALRRNFVPISDS